ncbi:hypothetical protein Tco_0004712 [Tanacetum coccineum]
MKKFVPSSRSKATEDIISIGSFVEVLVLNQCVLVRKILGKLSKLQDEDAQNKSNIQTQAGTPPSMCQTISNIDAHVEGEQFHESKQSRYNGFDIYITSTLIDFQMVLWRSRRDLPRDNPLVSVEVLRTSEGYKSTHKKMEILQEPPSNNALVETARRSLRNPVMEIRRSPKPNHRNPDGSSYWKKRHVKFDTPCSHFQILIKDIIIAEIPTTQLSFTTHMATTSSTGAQIGKDSFQEFQAPEVS